MDAKMRAHKFSWNFQSAKNVMADTRICIWMIQILCRFDTYCRVRYVQYTLQKIRLNIYVWHVGFIIVPKIYIATLGIRMTKTMMRVTLLSFSCPNISNEWDRIEDSIIIHHDVWMLQLGLRPPIGLTHLSLTLPPPSSCLPPNPNPNHPKSRRGRRQRGQWGRGEWISGKSESGWDIRG